MGTKKFGWILVAALVILAGCATPPPAPAATTTPPPIVITDAMGRTVTLPKTPERVVIAGGSGALVADAAYLFPEATTRLVALSLGKTVPSSFQALVDPQLSAKTIMDVQVGPEQIAAVKPDVVLVKSYMAQQLGKPLENLGLPVVYVDLETPDQYQRDLLTLGKVFQDEARAQQLTAYYQAKIDRVSKALAGLPEGSKPRVLLVYLFNTNGQAVFKAPPLTWLQTMMVEMAGGVPVWKTPQTGSGWTAVNMEQIAAWDPDQVYIVAYSNQVGTAAETAGVTATLDKIKADPQWQALRAVKEQKLYGFAGDLYSWDQPDPRWILGLTWLAAKVHPDRFAGLDLQAEAQSFFKDMYRLDAPAFEKNIVPALFGELH